MERKNWELIMMGRVWRVLFKLGILGLIIVFVLQTSGMVMDRKVIVILGRTVVISSLAIAINVLIVCFWLGIGGRKEKKKKRK